MRNHRCSQVIIRFVAAILVVVASASMPSASAQEYTRGDCSPIVKNITGNVAITCTFQGQIPVFKFSAIVDRTNAQTVMANLYEFVERNKKQIFELDLSLDSEVAQPEHCYWQNRDASMDRRCDWSSYAYSGSFAKQGEIILVQYDDSSTSSVDLNLSGEGIYWERGGFNVRGYYYVESEGYGQGAVQVNMREISKRELLKGGRHNLRN